MSDFEKRWWGDELVKTPKPEKYGDEWWFGGDSCGQIVIGQWVSGGCRTLNPRRWSTLLKQSELIASTLNHYVEHRTDPVESLAEAQSEIARIRGALEKIASIENKDFGGDWDEIEEARVIAKIALMKQ